jgi:hypothetical protein
VTSWILTAVVLGALGGGRASDRAALPQEARGGSRLDVSGDVSIAIDLLPRRDAIELRPDVSFVVDWRGGSVWRASAEVQVSALAASRGGAGAGDAVITPRELWIEASGRRAELRAGIGRLAWGKLDEVQPSDVVNPIDASRFFFAGRTEARLPVAFVRTRLFLAEALTVEGIVAPVFRRGWFDRLDEPTSPFNLTLDAPVPPGVLLASREVDHDDSRGWGGTSGGGRVSVTMGRVDWSVSAYRGRDAFGPISIAIDPAPQLPAPGRLVGTHPRFTMVAGDFETVTGPWGIRGEAAIFVERTLTSTSAPAGVRGRVVEAGIGVDRDVRGTRVFASVLLHREWSIGSDDIDTTDVDLVGSLERAFDRDRVRVRGFAVVNPADRFAFVRVVAARSLRDNLTGEASAGVFAGPRAVTRQALARFDGREFILLRLRYDF